MFINKMVDINQYYKNFDGIIINEDQIIDLSSIILDIFKKNINNILANIFNMKLMLVFP